MTPQELLEEIRERVVIEDGEELHSMNFEDLFQGFFEDFYGKIKYSCGASRMVIIPNDEDYVLKINFTKIVDDSYCCTEEDYSYDEEALENWKKQIKNSHEWYHDGCEGYYSMEEPGSQDYCKEECELYQKAAAAGLGEIFAAEWYVGNLDRLCVYAQEKVETLEFVNRDDSEESENSVTSYSSQKIEEVKKTIENLDGEGKTWMEAYDETRKNGKPLYHDYATYWFALVMLIDGYDFFLKLVDFCEKERIGDLHDCNVGFKDGKPIILDYATFR